ncbi:MAG: WYL domain-containing protein [Bacteroidetes bacterium]|nr:WYL domain-containing protein [Bacteroidota bacterium]
MPISVTAESRFLIIDRMFKSKRKKYYTLEDMKEACEYAGFKVGISQIEKDQAYMKKLPPRGKGAPIKWFAAEKGYRYTVPDFSLTEIPLIDKDFEELLLTVATLHEFRHLNMFKGSKAAIEKLFHAVQLEGMLELSKDDPFIQFDSNPVLTGSEFLQPLVEAIRERKVVTFNYKKFGEKKASLRTIHPYLLKEHKDRWYLIGMSEHYRDFVPTYGLDRMSKLKITEQDAEDSGKFDPKIFYKHAFGIITQKELKPEEVVLSFTHDQGMYARTKPLHSTQKVLIDNAKQYRIRMKVFVTIELIMEIQSYGTEVKVIKPKHLADLIKNNLQKASKQYK